MLRTATFCLAVVALGYGAAPASAAPIDRDRDRSSGVVGMVPADGHSTSGFAAIKSQGGQSLREGAAVEELGTTGAAKAGLARPEGDHAWTNGRAGLTSGVSSNLAIADPHAQQTSVAPNGVQAANPKGFAALKMQNKKGDEASSALQGARAAAGSPASANLLSPPPK